jgi:anti-sigma factor RsiW
MNCADAQELITGSIDDALSTDERAALGSHLRECRACQNARAIEAELRDKTRRAAGALNAPPDFKQKIATLVDYATRQTPQRANLRWWSTGRWQFAFAAMILVLVILPFLYFGQEPEKARAPVFFDLHRKAMAGEITFIDAKPDDLAGRLAQAAGDQLKPMGYDLSMLKVQPAAGAVTEWNGRKVLLVVYRGAGLEVTCLTFVGSEEDAPRAANLFFDPEKKINFHTFSDGGLNAVLHREGDVICVLVSSLPMAELLDAARAKARHA